MVRLNGSASHKVRIILPENVENIIRTLNDSGFEAYAVGGCIRDEILGRKASDWDIATSALPQDVQRIFKKTVDTGILHGTVSVIKEGLSYEITTYRAENSYTDFRHPDEVMFGVSLLEDLERRDFTINALAYHPDSGLIDRFGGLNDIKDKKIKTVGNADLRFSEDALRMLRAVRFSARLGFEIDPLTLKSMKKNSGFIRRISIERVRDELSGIILSKEPEKLAILFHTGILQHILPELDRKLGQMKNDEIRNILKTFRYVISEKTARWSLLEYISDGSGQIVKRLRFDSRTAARAAKIARNLNAKLGESTLEIRNTISEIGRDIFPCVLHIRKGLIRAGLGIKGEQDGSGANKTGRFDRALEEMSGINRTKMLFKEILRRRDPLEIRDLAINGRDLEALGINRGVLTGSILKALMNAVLENPLLNNKNDLIKMAISLAEADEKQTD